MLSKGDHFISIGPKDMYFKKEFNQRLDMISSFVFRGQSIFTNLKHRLPVNIE